MFHDLDAPELSAPLDPSLPDTCGALLSELGLSGRAIREILPEDAPAAPGIETEEFE